MSNLTVTRLGYFGEYGRYRLEMWVSKRPLLVALGATVTFAVFDGEKEDPETGLATIIRQEPDFDAALRGLDVTVAERAAMRDEMNWAA